MSLTRQADTLRRIAERLELTTLREVVKQPGVYEALRVSLYHHDGHSPDRVATVRHMAGKVCKLTVAYDTLKGALVYDFTIPLERYQSMQAALRQNKFDTLDDEENLPLMGVNLWLVERASGSFFHDVVFSPASPTGHYREIMLAIKDKLPEVIRELAV